MWSVTTPLVASSGTKVLEGKDKSYVIEKNVWTNVALGHRERDQIGFNAL